MSDEVNVLQEHPSEADVRKWLPWALGFIVVTYAALLLPEDWVQFLAGREMVFETIGSLLFLVASIFFFRAFKALGRKTGSLSGLEAQQAWWRRAAYMCLTVLLFLACGEELSWGQHFLGFETPEAIRELNVQEEVNLHNLWLLDSYGADGNKKQGWQALLLNSNRLFDYFMVILLWGLPLAHRFVRPAATFIDRFGGPVVPWILGVPLFLSFTLSVGAELLIVDGMLSHLAVSEIRELSYALLCALAAASLWRKELLL